MSMWKECEGLQEELVKMRRELHQIPEFGLDLPETQKYVTDKLDELGIPYKCSGTDSSIIAEIKGGQPGKRSEERRVGKECRSRWSPYH